MTVVQHEDDCPLDLFEGWMPGVALRVVRPYAGDALPAAEDVDALVVLGGHMNAHADDEFAWLPGTRDLLATATEAGVPVLGICLGAQLLAVACGGAVQVEAPPGIEAGIIDVHWRPGAAEDPLLGALAARPEPTFAAATMHHDAVWDLPPDAQWLAYSQTYPYQAFRVGRAAWGVQFHPEVSAATFERWAGDETGVDAAALVRQYADRRAQVEQTGRDIAGSFAALVVARHRDRVGAGARR